MASNSLIYRRGVYCDERGRDYFFDNAKFILIFLVVMAHAISPLKTGNETYTLIWSVCNTLHMPCLIFISGYFAKNYITRDGVKVQRPFTYAVLYLAAQITVALFEHFVLHDAVALSIFNARSSLWFLQCLFWWYLLLPILDRFQPKYVMIGTILLGLVAAYDMKIGNFLAFARMLQHMPFFMAGYYIQKGHIQRLFTKGSKVLGVLALAAGIGSLYLLRGAGTGRVITSNYTYWDIPMLTNNLPAGLWWLGRAWFYVTAGLLCFGFLAFTPRSWNLFTRFGSRTIAVYILHRYLYLAYLEYEWYTPFNTPWGRIAMIGIAFLLTIIFSLKPCVWPFELLQSIKVTAFLKKKPAAELAGNGESTAAPAIGEAAKRQPTADEPARQLPEQETTAQ